MRGMLVITKFFLRGFEGFFDGAAGGWGATNAYTAGLFEVTEPLNRIHNAGVGGSSPPVVDTSRSKMSQSISKSRFLSNKI